MRSLLRLRVTISYVLIAVAAAILLDHLGPHAQWHILRESSTNLQNLGDGHIATLVTSAFLTAGDVDWLWLASVAALFAVAEWVAGSKRFLATFAAGHVGATALVAVGLFVGIHADWLADSMAMAIDVGVSYAAAAVAGSLIAYLHGPWRIAWAAGWIAVVTVAAITDMSFTAIGHVTALTIGFGIGALFLVHDRKTLSVNGIEHVPSKVPATVAV